MNSNIYYEFLNIFYQHLKIQNNIGYPSSMLNIMDYFCFLKA